MDLIIYAPMAVVLVAAACFAAYTAGRYSKEYPSEEEMISRIVDGRMRERLKAKIDEELAIEISRQAQRSRSAT